MSLIFSRQCEYALQAVLYLALEKEGTRVPIKDLTRKLKIPYHFLGKIMQDLTRKGLLVSEKGPRGGFALAKPASAITLFNIVDAIDGADFSRSCVMGFPECSGKHPCAVHDQWDGLRKGISTMLVSKSIEQLARGMHKPGYASGDRTPQRG
jgi:Rrf2 family transcriptional regulator, iron-sulfur cluster assembly transcription factor